MYQADFMVIAAVIAFFALAFLSSYLQLKWHIYDLLVGKKHAFKIHLIVIAFAAAEVLFAVGFDMIYGRKWYAIPVAGIALVMSGLWVAGVAIGRGGISRLTRSYVFNGKQVQEKGLAGKEPMAIAAVCIFIGCGVGAGRYALFLCACLLALGFWVLRKIEKA